MYRRAVHTGVAAAGIALLAASSLAFAQGTARLRRHAAAPIPALQRLRVAPLAAPARPAAPRAIARYSIVSVVDGHQLALRSRPGGAAVAWVGAQTDFGSPQALSVAARRGDWLAVTTSALPNGTLGWVNARNRSIRLRETDVSVVITLSRRLLELRVGGHVVKRAEVGIGTPDSPTPTGRFAVSDELDGAAFGPYYGCCIIALTAHQPDVPPGWTGGDRIAIHGTDDPGTIGASESAGCIHADNADLRYLIRRLPLGTPVFIHG